MKNAFLTFGLTVALLGLACDSKEQCVADCDGKGSSGGDSSSSSGDDSSDDSVGDSTGGDPLACAEHRDDATEFILQNRDCETILDCVSADGICYDGEVANDCGAIGLSADADMDAWQAVADDMADACLCGASACGAGLLCNDEQQCETELFGSGAYCPSITRDVETFLAASRACEVDEDCKALPSSCRVDDCSAVVVNVNTDAADWAELDNRLLDCDAEESACNLVEGDCGVEPRCSEAGECVVGGL